MNKRFSYVCLWSVVWCLVSGVWCLVSSCAKPLAEGKLQAMEPMGRIVPFDANAIYYGTKWAMDELGYPYGPEDLTSGVVESKWIPTGAGSHYVDLFDGRDYGANAAYYKMVVRITPVEGGGKCKVEAQTKVKSVVNNIRSTGDKEREMLDKIAQHVRGYDISVTNLGVEE